MPNECFHHTWLQMHGLESHQMKQHLINSRFSYKVQFIKKGRKIESYAFLNGSHPGVITEVDLVDAPAAYKITWHDGGACVDVRAHAGSLWWPVKGKSGPLKAVEFLAMAAVDWDRTNAILDPLGRTYAFAGPTHDEYFRDLPFRTDKGYESGFDSQLNQARRDVARVLFVDDTVFVEAGDPVWYAVANDRKRDSFDLVIGHSALDRRNNHISFMPGPDLGIRLTSARLGRAIGLNELASGLEDLAAGEIQYRSTVEATGVHTAGPTEDLCARALTQYLWEIAWMYPDLRKAVPDLAKASNRSPPPASLSHLNILRQLISSSELPNFSRHLVADARKIVESIDRRGCSATKEDDEAAIASFAI